MRLLVRCDKCRLKYDATGRKVGGKFRCCCGQVVTIKRPRGHEADVIHCAACGAAREGGTKSCGYCGADFTIHETDLHTVCPGCQARVSDRARFCHHCATPLAADLVAGKASKLSCPVCEGRRLISRQLKDPDVTVLECQVCAGLWIGVETFHTLLDLEERREKGPAVSHRQIKVEGRQRYRKCPQCHGLMLRRNMGKGQKSRVVIDVCGEHGLWFDSDELAELLAFIRTGGLESARRDAALLKRSPDLARKREREDSHQPPKKRPSMAAMREVLGRDNDSWESDLGGEIILGGLSLIFDRLLR